MSCRRRETPPPPAARSPPASAEPRLEIREKQITDLRHLMLQGKHIYMNYYYEEVQSVESVTEIQQRVG